MVKGGRGGASCGIKPGRGGNKSRKSADTTGVPKRLGELGKCKDLEEKMFIFSVSNKADGNVFWKTLEAVVTYVGSHFGENVAKELQNQQKTILPPPVLNPFYQGKVEPNWLYIRQLCKRR